MLDPRAQAVLRSNSANTSYAVLEGAPSIPPFRLSDQALTHLAASRLCAPQPVASGLPGVCDCTTSTLTPIDEGHHLQFCRRGPAGTGPIATHNRVRDVFGAMARAAGMTVVTEERHLLRFVERSYSRPADLSVTTASGRRWCIDVGVTDCRGRGGAAMGRAVATDAYAASKASAVHVVRDTGARITIVEAARRINMEYRAVVIEAPGALGQVARDTFDSFSRHAHLTRGVHVEAFKIHWRRRLSSTLARALAEAAAMRARALDAVRLGEQRGYLPLGGHALNEADYGTFPVR